MLATRELRFDRPRLRCAAKLSTALLAAALACSSATARAAEPQAPPAGTEATRAEQDFVAASELALKGDLAGALALYKTLQERGIEHEDLDYNLGNAQAQSGHLIEAVLAYEHALRLAPNDADVRANLAIVRAKLEAAHPADAPSAAAEGGGQVALADVIEPLIAPFPVHLFAWTAVLSNMILFAALLWRRRTPSDRARRGASLLALAGGLVLALSLLVVSGHFIVARDPRAVVLESTEVKEGPHPRFKVSGRAGGGERVRVIDEDGGFLRILRRDGTSGWVVARAVERV